MITTTEDMRVTIQEWFAEAVSFDELRDAYFAVRQEADKQFSETADCIARMKYEEEKEDESIR